nr:uncharacterized protein ywbe [Quercus suber]
MNRPRNRQPRPPKNDNNKAKQSYRHTFPRGWNMNNVPKIGQVVPGAAVSIVLKADQSTGREVQGFVQDLLTRGDHPRGIKVRLQDGQVGRVQRMVRQTSSAASALYLPTKDQRSNEDRLDEEYLSEPAPRSLADFLPPSTPQPPTSSLTFATCPICGTFEGDEAAVTHHVEEHLR